MEFEPFWSTYLRVRDYAHEEGGWGGECTKVILGERPPVHISEAELAKALLSHLKEVGEAELTVRVRLALETDYVPSESASERCCPPYRPYEHTAVSGSFTVRWVMGPPAHTSTDAARYYMKATIAHVCDCLGSSV